MEKQQRPAIGMEVIDSDGHLVGTVESVEHDHFVVQKGFFFPKNHRIPDSAIDRIIGNEITLRMSREVVQNSSVDRNWANDPHHGENVPDASDTERSAIRGGVDPHKT